MTYDNGYNDFLVNVTVTDGSTRLHHWNTATNDPAEVAKEVVGSAYGATYILQNGYPMRVAVMKITVESEKEIFNVGIPLEAEKSLY